MLTVLEGDALEVLRTLPAESVHCVVTSPPYWGLRDYGTAEWDGGDLTCDHAFIPDPGVTSQRSGREYQQGHPHRICNCGAKRIDAQLGLEPTPEAYVAALVGVMAEVKRVLRHDGTLWLNLGDSYASDIKGSGGAGKSTLGPNRDLQNIGFQKMSPVRLHHGLKPKDLVGIPWRVAFALQQDGWYLRSDIIWSKPNPMPESVTDRPTKAHEYVFLLTKSQNYYYDAVAIQEPSIHAGRIVAYDGTQKNCSAPDAVNDRRTLFGFNGARSIEVKAGRNKRSVWTVPPPPTPTHTSLPTLLTSSNP